MDHTIELTTENVVTAARSRLYHAFSLLFCYPDAARSDKLSSELVMQDISAIAAELPYKLKVENRAFVTSGDIEELRQRHTGLFMIEHKGGNVSLSEKDYSSEQRDKLWEELIRFYEYFGLVYQYAKDKSREFPDHLVVQLEFMHYLTYLEAMNQGEASMSFRKAQLDFLSRHLGLWVPQLGQALAALEDGEPYTGFAALLGDFLVSEANYLAA